MSSKLLSAYGCIDFSSYFQAGSESRSVPRPEPAAAQCWSSTIGCPAWQPRPSLCIAVLRDRSVVGRAFDFVRILLLLLLLFVNATVVRASLKMLQCNLWYVDTISMVVYITFVNIILSCFNVEYILLFGNY